MPLQCPTPMLNTFLTQGNFFADGSSINPPSFGSFLRTPIDFYDNMAPFVEVTFRGNGNRISVGNQSSPGFDNTAVIKSFQYSAKTTKGGCTVELEIHDIEGGNFTLWYERINKLHKNAKPSKDYTMECKFGWAGVNCDGDSSSYQRSQSKRCSCSGLRLTRGDLSSPTVHFLPKTLSASYEGGKIKFKVEGIDLVQNISASQDDKAYSEMTLKCAIQEIMKRHLITKVNFWVKMPDGSCKDVAFVEGEGGQCAQEGNEGAKGKDVVYKGFNQDALKICLEWLTGVRSSPEKKAFVAGWNPCSREPNLIFWVSDVPSPDCEYEPKKSLGTYIVNGGKCSPVIQFSPKTKWEFAGHGGTGGHAGTVGSGETSSAKPKDKQPDGRSKKVDKELDTGDKTGGVGGGELTAHTSNFNSQTLTSQMEAQERANKAFHPIEAQLRIQGDPSYTSPLMMISRYIGIIVVNPMHYRKKKGAENCGDWLVQGPPVNAVFSNKAWMILGVTHQIKEGQFNTLLDVYIPAPGHELDPGIPPGCKGSGAVVPANAN